MDKKGKKNYESKKLYGKKYNAENITIQINRQLINQLKIKIGNLSVKKFLENLIQNEI